MNFRHLLKTGLAASICFVAMNSAVMGQDANDPLREVKYRVFEVAEDSEGNPARGEEIPISTSDLAKALQKVEVDFQAYLTDDNPEIRSTFHEQLKAELIEQQGEAYQYVADTLINALNSSGAVRGAAIEMLYVADLGKEECLKEGANWTMSGKPVLAVSTMKIDYNARPRASTEPVGRGNFKISTVKTILCHNGVTEDYKAINVNVQWVFNVDGNGLYYDENVGNYAVMLAAGGLDANGDLQGKKINVISIELNGARLPKSDPVYTSNENACIEIFFNNPIALPAGEVDLQSFYSQPVFCAGGSCKTDPPYLDATN